MSLAGLVCLVLAAASFGVGLVALRALRRRLELVARAEHELRGPATALALACQRLRHDPAAAGHAEALEAQLERLRAGLDDLAAAWRGGRAAVDGARSTAGHGARPGGGASSSIGSSRVDVASFVRAALEPWRMQLRRCSLDLEPMSVVGVTDRGRLAQAVGNLLANSAEHGAGDLRIRARRVPGAVRLEVRNQNRAMPADAGSGATPGSGAPNGGGASGSGAAAVGGEDVGRGRGLGIAADAARDLGGRLLVHTEGAATVAVLELPDGPGADSNPVERDDLRLARAAGPPAAGSDPAGPDAVP